MQHGVGKKKVGGGATANAAGTQRGLALLVQVTTGSSVQALLREAGRWLWQGLEGIGRF